MRRDEMMATISDLVALGPRATGTAGGVRAAAYVAERFTRAGLTDVHELRVPSYAWSASHCTLTLDAQEPVRFPCSPVLHSGLDDHDATGAVVDAPITARVVDIGAGRASSHDVRGAIVLFDLAFTMSTGHLLPLTEWFHDPHRELINREVLASRNPYVTSLTRVMREASAGGAVAVIGVLRDYPESVKYHNEYYRRSLLSLPGVWITRSEGERLRRLLQPRPETPMTLDLAATRHEVVSRTVIGLLPGRSNETIMVQSHHDSVGPGAVEDASGTAEVIALAEHFAAEKAAGRGLEKTLLFVTFDTHFTGYQAHQEFARRYALSEDSPHDLVLNVTIEHVGLRAVRGEDGSFATVQATEPRGIFENLSPRLKMHMARSLRRHRLTGTSLLNASVLEWGRLGIPTDASFMLLSGVPVASLISGPLYLYDDADTIDKVDVAQLEPVARYFADLICAADRTPGHRIGLLPRRLRRLLPRGRW